MCESNREAEQVAVLPEDRARLLSVWPEAAPLVLAAAPDGVELLENPAGIAAEELHFRLRALICFGADLAPLRAGFAAQFGADLPLIDLRGSAAEGTALRAGIFAGLWRLSAEETVVTARAHADALRQIAALRQENERLRSGFAALERAALQRDQGLRERVYWNQPQPGKSLPLRDGVPVVQRLACGAAGLSDVGFWLTDVQAQSGHLEVWLTTLQDGARHGEWRVEAAGLSAGSQRFSLPRALDVAEQTVALDLRWNGRGKVAVAIAAKHPDLRHGHRAGDEQSQDALATAAWRAPPGATCRPALSAHRVAGVEAPDRIVVNGRGLLDAINLNSGLPDLSFAQDSHDLLLHVRPEGQIAAARFENVDLTGATRLTARAMIRHPRAPNISFACALTPSGQRPADLALPQFAPHFTTGWHDLHPGAPQDLTLKDLPPVVDIYLLTRLTNPAHAPDFGWSSFSALTIDFGSEHA